MGLLVLALAGCLSSLTVPATIIVHRPVSSGPLSVPADVQASHQPTHSANRVQLSWAGVRDADHYRFEQNGEVSDLLDSPSAAVAVAGGKSYSYRVQAIRLDDRTRDSDWSQPVTLDVPASPEYSASALAQDFEVDDGLFEHADWETSRMTVEGGRLAARGDYKSAWASSYHVDFVDGSTTLIEFAPLVIAGDDQWIALDLDPGHGLSEERFCAYLARVDFGGDDKGWAVRLVDGHEPQHDEWFPTQTSVPAWARIHRDGNTLRFDVSDDGASWESLTSLPFTVEPRGVSIDIIGVSWDKSARPWNSHRVYFDNFNVPPSAAVPATP